MIIILASGVLTQYDDEIKKKKKKKVGELLLLFSYTTKNKKLSEIMSPISCLVLVLWHIDAYVTRVSGYTSQISKIASVSGPC